MNENKSGLVDALNGYGIEIEAIQETTAEDLLKQGYGRVSEEAKGRIDFFLQYIPGIGVELLERQDALKKGAEQIKGAYKVYLKEGTKLAKSRATEGAYRGAVLDSKDKLVGQAEFFEIEDPIKLVTAPKYALYLFDTLSAITGQYYMAEINHKLSDIESKIDRVVDYLENTVRGELWAIERILDRAFKSIKAILANEVQKASYYQEIISIKRELLSKMMLFDLQINAFRKELNVNSKEKNILELTEKVTEYYPQYWYSIFLYTKCVYCEIMLAQIDDLDFMKDMYDEIVEYIQRYKESYDKVYQELIDIIKKAKVFNLPKIPVGGVIALPLQGLIGGRLLYLAGSVMENMVAESKQKQGQEILSRFKAEMDDVLDTSVLYDQISAIDRRIDMVTSPIDIIRIGEDAYIKFLD